MRYVLNSAVITGPGRYEYRLVTAREAGEWLAAGPVESRVGYAETLSYIADFFGVDLPLSREATQMIPGDEALVVRLKYRIADPAMKGRVEPAPEDWELGILVKHA